MLFLWLGFIILILFFLALDLGVLNKNHHIVSTREALAWTAMWVATALVFNAVIYYLYMHHWFGVGIDVGHRTEAREAALQFFVGYIVEKSLSLDNIFVIAMIFAYFKIPLQYQHRILFWGIIGALFMRAMMIGLGAILIARFDWIIYVFGVFLIYTAIKMLVVRHDNLEPDKNLLVRIVRRFIPVCTQPDLSTFFVRVNKKLAVTPLFLALIVVETSDVLFAVDSIPAIFAITKDPFIVFTSNVFAILGLRSLYFVLASLMEKFRYIKMSLVFLLAYIGVKMLLTHVHPIPNLVSLAIIVGILCVGIVASIMDPKSDSAPLASPLKNNMEELAALTVKQVRRIIILIVGSTVLLIGVILIFTPGPALIVIPLGIAILSKEFLWARKLYRMVIESKYFKKNGK
ncbi:MAG: TerC/Alx family metal homeostasis membrane protein [Chlamydiota bacterium]|nr:TerC/Alx family metal homeostasis membrane protein [Chlamydiota bacterium]